MRTLDRKSEKSSRTISDPMMTQEKFDELKNKLERLKKSQPKAASEVSRLAELGDFSENTEYQMAKWKLRGINYSILRLEAELERAEIIPTNKFSSTVQIGHIVTVLKDGKETIYRILGSSESDPKNGVISYNSPIGLALMHHKVGDVVEIKLVNKIVEYKILKIE